jgi:thiol-disulfide isomerase/thioredoxin
MYSARLISLFSYLLFSQMLTGGPVRHFEISGTISGEYQGKIYLFFEDHYPQKDSISSEIKNGKFHFSGDIPMPVLCRIHLDQESLIGDFFMDAPTLSLACTNKIALFKNEKLQSDTLNNLTITRVEGSATEDLKSNFEKQLTELMASNQSAGAKDTAYFDMLTAFVKKNPKNKVSPYLVGKATTLSYSRVNEIAALIDPSLDGSFESRTVAGLLNWLDKTKNKAIGAAFHDVVLSDTSGRPVNTTRFRGNFVLVEFWASWCGPCRANNPSVKALYEKYKENKFEILGVSWDTDQDKWKKAIVKDRLSWPQTIDPKKELGNFYAIEAIPANMLLDKNGRILGVGLSNEEIEKYISMK